MKVKICGVTNLEDARLVVREDAWAIGMVRYSESPRFCSTEDMVAVGTALKRKCELVGVYVNASFDEIAFDVDQAGLTIVQLHGDEGPSFASEVRRRTGVKVIKAARIWDKSSIVSLLTTYEVDFYMLDASKKGLYGGTGDVFDWELAVERTLNSPVILSGGLTPENVRKGIETVEPYAVDVASGVEREPGKKDPEKLKNFFEVVRSMEPVSEDSEESRRKSTGDGD